jgi:hypothetical protein
MRPMDAPIRTKPVMDRIESEAREAVRRRAVTHGGATEYNDPEMFERVWSLLGHATGGRKRDFLLLPELLDEGREWDLEPRLSFTSHRPALGPFILLVKRRLLLPLARWLFDYTRENFRRQQQLNRILFACIEELAVENVRLQQQLSTLNAQRSTHNPQAATRTPQSTNESRS